MALDVFNRYEHKYLIDKDSFLKIKSVLDKYMELDVNCKDGKAYTISNIYYDTKDDYLIRTSLSKPVYKEKLRLRSYGDVKENSIVFLEIKKKYNGIVNKRRTALSLSEAYEFIKTGKKPVYKEYMNRQVRREIAYFLKIYNVEPKLYLAYDRIAYFGKDGSDLRISFDTNINTRRYDLFLEKGNYGESLIEKDEYLMEIKTVTAKPLWLVHILTELGISRKGFSKYGAEYKKQKIMR